ncbi:phosphoinositide 3-kinase regulatory subunit 6 isoform X2 [Siniperca chuatsi]|uniref:phosphoinositide 3-kinase regulatory subunit 6 isoform X2 n=1 Tax=Siniperca chuatsi TaxID=119488 RepID=UPI001CE06EFD|nr:phosphoinositide 3-kinase regulatory subunit 6 isoform X2 [Siniperca chuatsi]
MTNKTPWDNSSSMCSMDPTAGCSPTVPEPELYRSIQAVLPRDTDSQQHPDCFNKGMLRWTLHKKVLNNPANSLSLIWVLIKELEKAERWDSRKCIIPLLHTLMYAIIQTAYIPDELYKRLYDFCKRLLTYPHPYCTVGLSYTRQIKIERSIPGLMYQRMVTAEQRLKNEHYPFQDRVFVLADPEVFSGSLGQVLLGDIEASASASGGSLSPLDHMRSVVQHSIQAALGTEHCHGQKLARALKDMGQDVEPYFQEVLATLEQSVEEGGRGEGGALRSRLQQLYNEIIAYTESEPLSSGPLRDCPLPNPEMSFHLWTEELDIWRELAKWFRSSSTSEQFSLSLEQEDFELGESPGDLMPSDMTRFSIMSNDSGIERDLPLSADPSPLSLSLDTASLRASWEQCKSEQESSKLSRRGGIKMKPSMKDSMVLMQDTLEDHTSLGGGGGGGGGSGGRGGRRGATLQRRAGNSTMQNPFPKQQRNFTARIVVMGDDRVVGRLAKAYYIFRKREARRLFLTMKVNLQFYYIPVCRAANPLSSAKENLHQFKGNPCTLGSYLSMVDPWYNSNIKSLGCMIPKLAEMANPGKPKEPFVSDVISYYVRTGQQPVYFGIYFVKITFTSMTRDPVEDVFLTHLEMEFPEFRQISASIRDKPKKSSAEACGAVVSMNYRKVTLSGRDIDKGISVRTSGAQINAIPSDEAEDLNCLTLTLNESLTKTKNNNVSPIRTSNIKIRTLESRSFTLTLDRDYRRTYRDVQSIEISPCLDPGYCVQKTMRSKFKVGEDKDAGLSKYISKGLPLPINTFAGIIT